MFRPLWPPVQADPAPTVMRRNLCWSRAWLLEADTDADTVSRPPRWTPPGQSTTGDDWQEILGLLGAEDVKCERDRYLELTVPLPPHRLTRVWRGAAQDSRQWAQSDCWAGNLSYRKEEC